MMREILTEPGNVQNVLSKTWVIHLNNVRFLRGNTGLCYAKASDLLQSLPLPYLEISDILIEKYLIYQDFICTMNTNHKGIYDSSEHHAQRIASLIHLMQTDVELEPIIVYCRFVNKEISSICGIDDGWRASCYLDKTIAFYFDYNS